MMLTKAFPITRAAIIIFSIATLVYAESPPKIFATWEGFEADKCASIWLIKRFISPEAEIQIFPKGANIDKGVLFDVPSATFRRYHNMSTFESLLKHYELNDDRLVQMGKIIHDIEINTWERKAFEKTHDVIKEINQLVSKSKTNQEIIKTTMIYFDSFYSSVPMVAGQR